MTSARRWLGPLVALTALVCAVAPSAEPAGSGRFTLRGTVAYVVDGDTLEVALDDGRSERVRLIGVDTPERGSCLAGRARAEARRLADDTRVLLKGDATQVTHDRYDRLLAYVWIRGRRDLGFQLLARGLARVRVYDGRYERLRVYRYAERIGRRRPASIWTGCSPAP